MTYHHYIDTNGIQYCMTEQDAENFKGVSKITTPYPDDGKDYIYSLKKDTWEEVIQDNPTTAELFDRVSDRLGVPKDELTGMINGLIDKYMPQLPAPSREDIFKLANKPSKQGDYDTTKPLTDFEYLGFVWNTDVKGNRQEELLIPTRAFLALPTVSIGQWTINPVSSITKNQGKNSFCVCPIRGETSKIRISRVNDYFLQSIFGYK